MSEHANTGKHVSEHSYSFVWVILSILAQLAHLAHSYFSLIFSIINVYNCSRFDLTNKKIAVTEDKSLVKSEQHLQLFSSRWQTPLLVKRSYLISIHMMLISAMISMSKQCQNVNNFSHICKFLEIAALEDLWTNHFQRRCPRQ